MIITMLYIGTYNLKCMYVLRGNMNYLSEGYSTKTKLRRLCLGFLGKTQRGSLTSFLYFLFDKIPIELAT